MSHPNKHKAKSKPKRQSIFRRLASDNRVRGIFLTLFILFIGAGLFAINQQQIYKSEASPTTSCKVYNCDHHDTFFNHCSNNATIRALCFSSNHDGGLAYKCVARAQFRKNGSGKAYYVDTGGGHFKPCTCESSSGLNGTCYNPSGNNCVGGKVGNGNFICGGGGLACCYAGGRVVPEGSGSGSGSGGSGSGRVCSRNNPCPPGQHCGSQNSLGVGRCASDSGSTGGSANCGDPGESCCGSGSGASGTCHTSDRGPVTCTSEHKCKIVKKLGEGCSDQSKTTCKDGSVNKCVFGKCVNTGETACRANGGNCAIAGTQGGCPAGKSKAGSSDTCNGSAYRCCKTGGGGGGGGASTDPSTPSQFADGGLGGNNQLGTGVTADNGGAHAPAGKDHADCSISQKPSSITPSGTVKPGSKTLRWSAVSKVTKYKVTVNSTARDVTGTSMPLTVKDKKTYNIKVQAYICGKAGNAKTATIKGDVNKGGTPTGGACKAEGTQCGLHGGSNPGSQCCSKVCIDNKCAAEGTPTAEPTDTPIASIEASLKISLRFQGLNSTSSKKFLSEKTRVTLVHTPSNTVFEPKTVDFRIVDALRWEGEARFAGVASGSGYLVAIKGPQHVQRLICDDQPAETSGSIGGLYKCERDGDDHQIGGITLGRGANILDFDGITQFVGDLPEQDGVIDSLDLANVRQSLGSTDSDALEVADLNLDGVVNTADFSLVIQGLERYRADENYTGVQLEEE